MTSKIVSLYSVVDGVWVGSMGWKYGLEVWAGSMGWKYGLEVWAGCMGWKYGLGI